MLPMITVELFLILELDIFCLGLCSLMLMRDRFGMDDDAPGHMFAHVTIYIGALITCDMLWQLVTFAQGPVWIEYLLNVVFTCLLGFASYGWLAYVIVKVKKMRPSLKVRAWLFTPLAILILLALITPLVHVLFSIKAHAYVPGPLYVVQPIICLGYLLSASAVAFSGRAHTLEPEDRSDFLWIALFVIPPLAVTILQIFYPQFPLIWPTVTFSLILVYLQAQHHRIFSDALTGLNNRRSFDRFIRHHYRDYENNGEGRVVLLLIDIDRFKGINDRYGHTEGDRALAVVADALKEVCAGQHAFLARYGGDEFAILLQVHDLEPVRRLEAEIHAAIDRVARAADLPYELHLSIGIAGLERVPAASPTELVNRADSAMYEQKTQ